jgi:hypothetical protein
MIASILADAVLVVHLLFIAFVVAGGAMLRRWPRVAWVHVPAAAWGTYATASGAICPLTPIENLFRRSAGEAGYEGGFIEHYLLPLIYPAGLTPTVQLVLGLVVVAVNAVTYGRWLLRRRRRDVGSPR